MFLLYRRHHIKQSTPSLYSIFYLGPPSHTTSSCLYPSIFQTFLLFPTIFSRTPSPPPSSTNFPLLQSILFNLDLTFPFFQVYLQEKVNEWNRNVQEEYTDIFSIRKFWFPEKLWISLFTFDTMLHFYSFFFTFWPVLNMCH